VNLSFLPASLPMWAKTALLIAIVVLPGGSLIPVLWLVLERTRSPARVQPVMLALAPGLSRAWLRKR
jgi:hypothetical protein